MILFVDVSLRQKHVIARLKTVSYEAYTQRKARWTNRLSEGIQRRSQSAHFSAAIGGAMGSNCGRSLIVSLKIVSGNY